MNCHTYCKFGIYEPYLLQVWLIVPNLLQVWQRCSGSTNLAHFWQHQLDNTKVIKEFQVSHAKNKTTCITGGFGAYASSLRLRVACAQQAKALNIKMARRLIFSPLAFHRDKYGRICPSRLYMSKLTPLSSDPWQWPSQRDPAEGQAAKAGRLFPTPHTLE